jgi:hypothetical protein
VPPGLRSTLARLTMEIRKTEAWQTGSALSKTVELVTAFNEWEHLVYIVQKPGYKMEIPVDYAKSAANFGRTRSIIYPQNLSILRKRRKSTYLRSGD